MALPDKDQAWPPLNLKDAYDDVTTWDAWYTGDIDQLEWLYSTTRLQTKSSIWGQVRRRFFGTPTPTTTSQVPVKMHVPVPAEIAAMSANLLFEEIPKIAFPLPDPEDTDDVDDHDSDDVPVSQAKVINDRLSELFDDDAHAALLESAEFQAAHGGAYLRVLWDQKVEPDKPFLSVVTADAAVPTFRHRRLVAVTFWDQLGPARDGDTGVWRLLECHEPGTIEWGLYWSGDAQSLGQRMPLTEHPSTQHLAPVVDQNSTVQTGSDLLTAVYMPNIAPNRSRRKDPVGKNFGRSDFDGVEDLFDAVDEAFTSWMRDLRLGKARIMVPKGMLTSMGAGKGATFNADQEVFTELGAQIGSLNPAAKSGQGSVQSFIETFQPNIRSVEHLATITALLERVYEGSGYSTQTFGNAPTGGARTATEIIAKEKLTMLTRSKKVTTMRPKLQKLAAVMLDIDKHVFQGPGRPAGDLPEIEWQDAVGQDSFQTAQTLQALYTSESATRKERVSMLHPDWEKDQIDTEVQQLEKEFPSTVMHSPITDPFATGEDPADGFTPAASK
ncbi:phage portal protein [Humibacter sp.]|uniref:phage portal protein n=1 Tax=Humibacter sp. TaxID=1940291 RepID=UPI003F7EA811